MRQQTRFSLLITILIFFLLACAAVDFAFPAPVTPPTEISAIAPYPNRTARPTSTRTATPAPVIFTPAVFPAWVNTFSEPILKSLQNQRPDFEDTFPAICIKDESDKWKVCSTPEQRLNYQDPLYDLVFATARPTLDLQPDLRDGYSLLNTGWFYDVPGSLKNPHLALIDESGMLVLNLPNGNEKKDFWAYHRSFGYKNFVLQFDMEFRETQPEDIFRFQFQQPEGGYFALDLTKNKTWQFHWGTGAEVQFREGMYDYLELPQARILIIAQDSDCAFYLNAVAIEFIENCRVPTTEKIKAKAATFHIISDALHSAVVTVDNVMIWDLDKKK